MSNESVPDCLTHKDSRNIQVRLDYMLLYRSETKAKVIRIMETWTNQKRAEWQKHYVESKEQGFDVPEEAPEEALWVTMSYEEFSIYAYGTMNHDNIKQNVDALVEHEHLKRRPHPQIPYGPPQYLLDTWLLQELLNEQELPSLFDDIGKIKPPRKKRTPQVKYPQGEGINTPRVGGKIPPGTGENTPPSKNTTKNYRESTKNEDEGANAPAALINFAERKTESDKHKAVRVSDSHMDIGNDDEEDIGLAETTPRTPAVTKGANHEPSRDHRTGDLSELLPARIAHPDLGSDLPGQEEITYAQTPAASVSLSLAIAPNGGQDDTGGRQAIRSPVSLSTLTPAAPVGLSVTGTPPASPEARQGRQVIPRRPRGKKPPVLEITMNGMLVKGWYEAARGSKIRMTEKNVAACNTLGDDENVTCLSLKAVIEHLDGLTWVKEHDFAIDIQVLADDKSRLNFEKNWPVVKRKLERRGQESKQIDFDDYVGNGPEERAKRRILYEEMKARGELIS